MTPNLPAVLDESNIDNSDLETQVEFYRANIEKLEKISSQVETVMVDVEDYMKTIPQFVDVSLKCNELYAKIEVMREQIHYLLTPDVPPPKNSREESSSNNKKDTNDSESLSTRAKRRYSALKKKIARLLHPDKTKYDFNSALYHTAMKLLELHDFDGLEKLLNDIETARSKKASSYSRMQARDSLRSMLDDLKIRYNKINSELLEKLQSNEGIIFKVATSYGIQSRPTFNTVMNIQIQSLHNLQDEYSELVQRMQIIQNAKHKFSHDDSDFTV